MNKFTSIVHGLLTVFVLSIMFLVASNAQAQLVIKGNDINEGAYTYSLTFSDIPALDPGNKEAGDSWDTGNKFFDDVWSATNVKINRFWGGNRASINMTNGSINAEFIYRFDFSDSGFLVDSMSVKEIVRREQDGATYEKRNSTGFASYYSIDGVEWIELASLSAGVGYQGQVNHQSLPIVLSAVPEVWYRVVLTSSGPLYGSYPVDGAGTVGVTGVNWNYVTNTSSDFFTISFEVTAIPETASLGMLLALGVLGYTYMNRCKTR